MIGTDINPDLPTLDDSFTDIVTKIVTALEDVCDSIAQKATPAALNINTALDVGGNSVTNVASLVLAEGNAAQTPGSVFYFDGDFYAVDEVGLIKLTDNGALNAAGIAGIGGDYGGVNPALVYFDDSSQEYRFYDDGSTLTYADLVADDLVLNGSAGSVRLSVASGITSAREISFDSLPATGRSLLVYDASDNKLKDSATIAVDNDIAFANVTATEYKHSGQSARISMSPATKLTNCGLTEYGGLTGAFELVTSGASWIWASPALPLITGDRIISWTMKVSTAVAGNISVIVYKAKSDGTFAAHDSYTFNPGTTAGNYAHAPASPTALDSTEYYYFIVSGASSGVHIQSIGYTYDHP